MLELLENLSFKKKSILKKLIWLFSFYYNLLIKDNLNIHCYPTEFVTVFGTPEEVENFEAWQTILKGLQVRNEENLIKTKNQTIPRPSAITTSLSNQHEAHAPGSTCLARSARWSSVVKRATEEVWR